MAPAFSRTSQSKSSSDASQEPFSRIFTRPLASSRSSPCLRLSRSSTEAKYRREEPSREAAGQNVATALLQLKAGYANRWISLVPLYRKGLVAELKIAPIVRRQGRRSGAEQPLLISQNYLIEGIVEFQRDLDLTNRTRAIIQHSPENESHFLIQKVCGAGHLGLQKLDPRHVGLLRRAHRQRLLDGLRWRRRQASDQVKDADQQQRGGHPDQQNDWRSALFFIHVISLDAASPSEGQAQNQRFRRPGPFHAILHSGNIVRRAPEFHCSFFEVGDSKGSSRVTIARLTYRAGVQQITCLSFEMNYSRMCPRLRRYLDVFDPRAVIGKATLNVRVAKES